MGPRTFIYEAVGGVVEFSQRQIDRVVCPETRHKAYSRLTDFATTRPVLFSFIAAQASLSLVPLILFLSFVASTLLFTLGCALAFSLFWTGVALFFLVPALLVTSTAALCLWAWGLASFTAGRWALGAVHALANATTGEEPDSSSLSSPAGFGDLRLSKGAAGVPPPPAPTPAPPPLSERALAPPTSITRPKSKDGASDGSLAVEVDEEQSRHEKDAATSTGDLKSSVEWQA